MHTKAVAITWNITILCQTLHHAELVSSLHGLLTLPPAVPLIPDMHSIPVEMVSTNRIILRALLLLEQGLLPKPPEKSRDASEVAAHAVTMMPTTNWSDAFIRKEALRIITCPDDLSRPLDWDVEVCLVGEHSRWRTQTLSPRSTHSFERHVYFLNKSQKRDVDSINSKPIKMANICRCNRINEG